MIPLCSSLEDKGKNQGNMRWYCKKKKFYPDAIHCLSCIQNIPKKEKQKREITDFL